MGSLVDNPDVQRTTKVTRLLDEAEAKAGEVAVSGVEVKAPEIKPGKETKY